MWVSGEWRSISRNNGKNQPVTPVKFAWKSTKGEQQCAMTATLPDAVYQGPFFQITSQAEGEDLAPLWVVWNNCSGMIGRIGAMAMRAATTRCNTLPNI
jgi:hypothetical protein